MMVLLTGRLDFSERCEQPRELWRAVLIIINRLRPEDTQADWPWIGADQAQIMEQSQMVLERRDRFRLGACLEEVDRIGVERALMAR